MYNHEQIPAYARDVFKWQKMKQLKLKLKAPKNSGLKGWILDLSGF
jgi:hypothetical protein